MQLINQPGSAKGTNEGEKQKTNPGYISHIVKLKKKRAGGKEQSVKKEKTVKDIFRYVCICTDHPEGDTGKRSQLPPLKRRR